MSADGFLWQFIPDNNLFQTIERGGGDIKRVVGVRSEGERKRKIEREWERTATEKIHLLDRSDAMKFENELDFYAASRE